MNDQKDDVEEEVSPEYLPLMESIGAKVKGMGLEPIDPKARVWAHWHIRLCDFIVMLRAMGQDDATIEAAILAGMAKRFDPALADVSPPLTLSFEGDQWDAASAASQ